MKKFTRPQYYRIRRILDMIRAGTGRAKLPSRTDFVRELEISARTAMRDLDMLRDDLGAPIEYDASRKGYCLTDQRWSLPTVELGRREVFAFSVARKLVESFRGTALEMDMVSVFDKIADSLEGRITMDPGSLTERFTVIGEDHVVQDPEIWATMAQCVERGERLEMVYQKFSGQVGHYGLDPYHLVAYHGNWYVVGHVPDRERVQTFAISRVRRAEGTGRFFEMPEDFDAKAYLRAGFGIVGGDEILRVRVRFAPKVAAYIRERVWHPSQRLIEKRDGGIELQFETTGWKELVRWVLSWQPDVKVLAPKRLRERVELKMRQALGLAEDD